MKYNIQNLLTNIDKVKILVIGDFMIDEFLIGKVKRINPEAPVPILNVNEEKFVLGGAGNVVTNIISLGASAFVSTVIGDDVDVSIMETLIKNHNIDTGGVIKETNRVTTRKTRLISEHQHLIRYDRETTKPIIQKSEDQIISYSKSIIDDIDAVILEDYYKGVFTDRLLKKLIKLFNSKDKPILIDPSKRDWSAYSGATIITPNVDEASFILDRELTTESDLEKAGFDIMSRYDLPHLLITRSEQGMSLFIKKEKEKIDIPTKALDVYDEAGAGDTVVASLGVGIACGLSYPEASNFANTTAGIVVGKSGIATVTLTEVIRHINEQDKLNIYIKDRKHLTHDEIRSMCLNIRLKRKKIVFTNGCFDLLHVGHVRHLEAASKLGDVFIVGINSDTSIRRIKDDDNRPIYNVEERIQMLSVLNFVDYITVFDEDTPIELLKIIKPDVLVKGGDYTVDQVVGKEIVEEAGGEVVIIDLERKYKKHLSRKEVKTTCENLRLSRNKIVFTNGCFDLLHVGHVRHLEAASKLGDVFIVGINSDASIKRLKGDNRPIYNEDERIEMLSALNFIDYITIFDEDTPIKLIETIKPNILVKGGDYNVEDVVGKDTVEKAGGEVVIVDLERRSTTRAIDLLKNEKF